MHPHLLTRLAAVALAALALLAAACGGLGDDELPEEIGSSEREEIVEVLEAFFEGVNRYNPEVAGEVMLIPAELGIPEVERMVWEIGALQGEELRFEFRSLGVVAPAYDTDRAVPFVRARALTSFGERELQLVRRGGQWRLGAVPDLSVPSEVGTVHLQADVHRWGEDARGIPVVVGEVTNQGDDVAQVLSLAVLLLDNEGRSIGTGSAYLAEAVLWPGTSVAFRAALGSYGGVQADDVSVVVLGRRPHESDYEAIENAQVDVSPAERLTTESGVEAARSTVQNLGMRTVIVFAAAVAYDGNGQVMALGPGVSGGYQLEPGTEISIQIALPDLANGAQVAELRLAYQAIEKG
jgi:hypothetical protein